jgi:hypothetical protein
MKKMKKSKKPKKRIHHLGLRNAAPVAAPARPRAPRIPRARTESTEASPLRRLGYTAAGAAGSALVGSFLAREQWAPKTIAGLLTTAGAIASWTSHDPMVQQVGSGAMAAGGGQLALMLLDDHEKDGAKPGAKHANADGLPPGALESAFERARARMAVMTDEARRYSDG